MSDDMTARLDKIERAIDLYDSMIGAGRDDAEAASERRRREIQEVRAELQELREALFFQIEQVRQEATRLAR